MTDQPRADRARRRSVDDAEVEGPLPPGDWVAGEGRLHAALRNGLDVGEGIADAV